jgi:hypothetical protein
MTTHRLTPPFFTRLFLTENNITVVPHPTYFSLSLAGVRERNIQKHAACRRSQCQLLRIEVATWSERLIPMVIFSIF